MSNYFAKIGKAILAGEASEDDGLWGWRPAVDSPSGTHRWFWGRGGPKGLARRENPPERALEIRSFNDLHGAFFDPMARRDRLHHWVSSWKGGGCEASRFLFGVGDDHVGVPRWDEVMDDPVAADPAYALYLSVGVDAIVPGNHDLDWGFVHWRGKIARVPELSFVWSNLANSGEEGDAAELPLAPAWILERDGVRVGVLGLLSEIPSIAGDLELCDPVAAAVGGWAMLRDYVDYAVVLSHLGDDAALRAALPPEVLVLGAHVHRFEPMPERTWQPANLLVAGAHGTHLGEAFCVPRGRDRHWKARVIIWPKVSPGAPISTAERAWLESFARDDATLANDEEAPSWPSALRGDLGEALAWMAAQLTRLPLSETERKLGVDANLALIGKSAVSVWPPPSPSRDRVAWRHVFPFQDTILTALISPAKALELMAEGTWTTEGSATEGASCACGGGNGAVRLVTHSYAAKGLGDYAADWAKAGIDPSRLPWQETGVRLRDFLWKALSV
jgi:hypothetical protein